MKDGKQYKVASIKEIFSDIPTEHLPEFFEFLQASVETFHAVGNAYGEVERCLFGDKSIKLKPPESFTWVNDGERVIKIEMNQPPPTEDCK